MGIPDYFQIIQTPMDFGTIVKKLKQKKYPKAESFITDVCLVFSNCVRYNGLESDAATLTKEVYKEFKSLYTQLNMS
jgi:hypothetical protein